MSLGYFDLGGIIDKYSFKRYNLRSNLVIKMAHGLNLGLDIGARQEIRNQGYYSVSNQAWNNPLTLAQRMMPITPTEYEGLPVAANISTSAKFNPMAFNS